MSSTATDLARVIGGAVPEDMQGQFPGVYRATVTRSTPGELFFTVPSFSDELEFGPADNPSALEEGATIGVAFLEGDSDQPIVIEGWHPDLDMHDDMGLATDAELASHAGASAPHPGHLKGGNAMLESDFPHSSSALDDVDGVALPMEANADYVVDVYILFTSSVVTTGIRFALDGPAGPVAVGLISSIGVTLTTVRTDIHRGYNQGGASASVDSAGAVMPASIRGNVRNGPNAGDLKLRVASETEGVTVTVLKGTTMTLREVP